MEAISVFDIFKIGVGPSSSHTMGPWRASQRFLSECDARGGLQSVQHVHIDLFGSLAKTGRGHGTDIAVMLGLRDEDPELIDPDTIAGTIESIRTTCVISLGGANPIPFKATEDIRFHKDRSLPFHPNGITFTASMSNGSAIEETYYSVGGGFVVQEGASGDYVSATDIPFPTETADHLLLHCRSRGWTIPEVVRANERAWRTDAQIRERLARIWSCMKACIFRGCTTRGTLPGGLFVTRRAADISDKLLTCRKFNTVEDWICAVRECGGSFDQVSRWVSCFALAVNEENAAFGRVVTAPTNGAAGVIPAVLLYASISLGASEESIESFLLTGGVIGSIFKQGATLSAAMGGCQAEIGVSSAMAAAGLAQCLGGTPEQVLMAAEIAMEHHLGLTCDPVGGLVQVPCIERNTMGAHKAITAAYLALDSDPANAKVSLDTVVRSMWQTALDMNHKYKETSEGGLALQIPVNLPEC